MHRLKFRRQFLLTPIPCQTLPHWQHFRHVHFHIYAHPDLPFSTFSKSQTSKVEIGLIGYIIDPYHPEWGNAEIIRDLCNLTTSVGSIVSYLNNMAGRFVLIVTINTETLIFHDTCGLRSVYYTIYNGHFYAGSQPLILSQAIPIMKSENHSVFHESEYKKNTLEHWIPTGISLYENIYHLAPNHYLNLTDGSQVRYWPNKKLLLRKADEVVHEAAELIRLLLEAGNRRFQMAVTITGGLDSRILLGGCRSIASDVYFYTLKYRHLQTNSDDIRIPRKILKHLGIPHHVLDCTSICDDKEFCSIYLDNVDMPHMNDWGNIAYGMLNDFPESRVATKGSCMEINRLAYHKYQKSFPITSIEELINIEVGWNKIPFIVDAIDEWFHKTVSICKSNEFDILDLYYWEQRLGSWQAQNQLEWDIVQETYCPFNHRGLIELLHCVPEFYRSEQHAHPLYPKKPKYALFTEINKILWKEITLYPVNPFWNKEFKIKRLIMKLGLEQIARKLHTILMGR